MKKTNKYLLTLLLGMTLASCGGNNASNTTKVEFDTSKNITVYTRDTDSGTRDGFFTKIGLKDAVKSNEPLVKGAVKTNGNGDMVLKVKNDEYGISYISLSSLEESSLTRLKYEGVEPNEDNVLKRSRNWYK